MNSDYKEAIGRMRTKIVATLGPASSDALLLGAAWLTPGADVFRLNFSQHGLRATHTATLESDSARSAGKRGFSSPCCRTCAGPRSGWDSTAGSSFAIWTPSSCSRVTPTGVKSDPDCLTSTHRELADDLEPGQSVLFADGTVAMDVIDRGPGRARLKVTLPGQIRSHQGINVPGRG